MRSLRQGRGVFVELAERVRCHPGNHQAHSLFEVDAGVDQQATDVQRDGIASGLGHDEQQEGNYAAKHRQPRVANQRPVAPTPKKQVVEVDDVLAVGVDFLKDFGAGARTG